MRRQASTEMNVTPVQERDAQKLREITDLEEALDVAFAPLRSSWVESAERAELQMAREQKSKEAKKSKHREKNESSHS